MPEDKEELILEDLKKEARDMKQGVIKIEFKIHEGKIALAEIIEYRRKLG